MRVAVLKYSADAGGGGRARAVDVEVYFDKHSCYQRKRDCVVSTLEGPQDACCVK